MRRADIVIRGIAVEDNLETDLALLFIDKIADVHGQQGQYTLEFHFDVGPQNDIVEQEHVDRFLFFGLELTLAD